MNAITKSNVISAKDYKKMVLEVLEFAGKTVCKTLGPCANTSIIEDMGPLVASKDGFHTIQRIRFANEDIFANNVMNVIKTISHRMVATVGDGSSSAVVAAWKFAELLNDRSDKFLRPRTLNETFGKAIKNIIEKIEETAIRPTIDKLPEVMYNTAYVSTNGDTKFAEQIRDAYIKSNGDVVFSVRKSPIWSTETKFEQISGYKANHYYMIDNIFHNRPGGFVGKDVYVVCFDMSIDSYHYNMIHRIEQLAHQQDANIYTPSEIIIVAPSYSQNFLDMVKRDVDMDLQLIRAKQKNHISIRYMRCLNINAQQRNEFMDFAMLCGSNPLTAADFNKMVDIVTSTENFDDEILKRSIGKVNSIRTHRNEYSIIDGFSKLDEERFGIVLNQVQSDLERESNENMNRRIPSGLYVSLRNRLQRLERRIVEVIVGAENEIEMELNFDAAEDATRACESVARHGYNSGSNLAIITTAQFLANEISSKPNENLTPEENNLINAYKIIALTFINTLWEVVSNKFTSDGSANLSDEQRNEVEEIIRKSVSIGISYDLVEDKLSSKIINSPQTDIEILKGAINMCLTLMTANQYIAQIPTVEKI